MRTPELGIIEGFYGKPWSWEERAHAIRFLAPRGYRFFLYAPKGDAYLRKSWREDFPLETERALERLIAIARDAGAAFGVGLSPYELYRDFDDEGRAALLRRIELFNRLGVDRLAILFDDMKGDLPDLARTQVEVLHFVREHSRAKRLLSCPTYYSDDPILDRVFGQRPAGYLEELGRLLDPSIGLYWTGPEICSKEYPAEHLRHASETLRRPLDLWDNYPVNDGQRMCKFLHLRAFSGRGPAMAPYVASHGVNPMNQARLSLIPALTLGEIYRGEAGDFRSAAEKVVAPELARMLEEDLPSFQDRGLDALSGDERSNLRARYSSFEDPAAREVVEWLDGKTIVTRELVLTQ